MKKKDLYTFRNGLKMTRFDHPRCTYAVNKNKRLVEAIIEDMEKTVAQTDEIKKFFKEREDLAKKHCLNDENGKPKLKEEGAGRMVYEIEGQYDEKSAYRKDMAKLNKKFAAEIEKHEEKMKNYNTEFLDDDTEYRPFMLPLTLLEQHEKCPQSVMDMIFWMVDDNK